MKWKGKVIVLVCIAVLLLAGYGVDCAITAGYDMQVIETSAQPIPADGQTPVIIRVQVLNRGNPAAGHAIMAASGNGGSFKSKRLTTDENGLVEFTYYPYLKTQINTLTDVYLSFWDESNSLFISVPARTSTVLKMKEPDGGGKENSTNDSLFG